ncbi:exodeoxyribonuclease VII large subunit [Spirochaetota bacterium]
MQAKNALSVSELTQILKTMIEDAFQELVVEGEISNWRPASSGHVYFTLKDSNAQLQAVMFKAKAARLAFLPADGLFVRAKGSLGLYAARGQYQIVVDSMEAAGKGDILAMLEERKKRLAMEGLFDPDKKPRLPEFPGRVAIISSPGGAALRDILSVLKRRNSGIRVTILPALVQGDDAPPAIVRQLKAANDFALGDVIILARGGGSIEDLLAFSDEAVVRTVAASKIPVISAIGHEIDWSLSDYAASLRAPTPSAAAELVSENADTTRSRVLTAARTLELSMKARTEKAKLLADSFKAENLELRFSRILMSFRQGFDDAKENIVEDMLLSSQSARQRLSMASALLHSSSPEAILSRGYAIVRKDGSKKAIRNAKTLKPKDALSIIFEKGQATAEVMEVDK